MRKIDVAPITNSIGFPVKAGTLTHLQLAYQEAMNGLGMALAGSSYVTNKVYILNGCQNVGSGANYNITAGAVFYNGEVYMVDAAVFTASGSNVAVGVIATTFFADSAADPVQFTDGVLRNVHQIRKMVMQAGLSGSGAANFVDFVDVTRRLSGALGEIKIWNWKFYGGALSDYFNTTTGLGVHPYTIGWAICDGQNLTDDMRGLTAVGYSSIDADFNLPFTDNGGEKTHTLTLPEIPPHSHSLPGTNTGTPGTNAINQNANQDATFFTGSAGTGDAHNNMQPYRAVLYVQRIA